VGDDFEVQNRLENLEKKEEQIIEYEAKIV